MTLMQRKAACALTEAMSGPTFDGYSYAAVLIGDQCWFAENLRTTVYADGSGDSGGRLASRLGRVEHRCAL